MTTPRSPRSDTLRVHVYADHEDLRLLAPEIQEELLTLERVINGRDSLSLRQVQIDSAGGERLENSTKSVASVDRVLNDPLLLKNGRDTADTCFHFARADTLAECT